MTSATCDFVNGREGSITIVKQADPADGTPFSFRGGLGDFALDHDGSKTVANLLPGTYAVTENDPSDLGFELGGLSCVDSVKRGKRSTGDVASRTATVRLEPGETVTCTFTNSQEDTVTVEKVVNPASGESFGFSGDLGASNQQVRFSLKGGEVKDFTNVTPGEYTVSENAPLPAGYQLTELTCVDSASGGSYAGDLATRSVRLSLAPGARVHCTFINERPAPTALEETEQPLPPGTHMFLPLVNN